MPTERESQRVPLSAIRIDLKDRSVTFEADDKPLATISLAPHGVIFEAHLSPLPENPTAAAEREKTIALTGKLKSQPKEGKPDSRGNPTAWARLAVHEEERKDAHIYLASFHRHTVPIALTLPKETSIIAEGYPHRSADPKRLDTFSVINLVQYPGKPEKAKRT